jgi:hypothetical protein
MVLASAAAAYRARWRWPGQCASLFVGLILNWKVSKWIKDRETRTWLLPRKTYKE